jgi:glutaredoxin 3
VIQFQRRIVSCSTAPPFTQGSEGCGVSAGRNLYPDYCGYCTRAKALLAAKGVQVIEYRAGDDPEKRREMIQRSRGTTYPQIFIIGRHFGGSDDIHDLDYDGKLDPLLAEAAAA